MNITATIVLYKETCSKNCILFFVKIFRIKDLIFSHY